MINKTTLITLAIFIILSLAIRSLIKPEESISDAGIEYIEQSNMSPSLKMYYSILHFSKKYNVPKEYIFSIAYHETGYKGPFHWDYNPYQTSFAGAVGPMQLIPSTANWINKSKYSEKTIRTNIALNVETSVKYIAYLKRKLKKWELVFGYYNTGYPIVNEYALNVVNKEYVWNK